MKKKIKKSKAPFLQPARKLRSSQIKMKTEKQKIENRKID
jgi:hypothetical protein